MLKNVIIAYEKSITFAVLNIIGMLVIYTQLAAQIESNPMEYPGTPLPKNTKVSYDKINGSAYHNKKFMKGKIVMLAGDTLIRYLRYDMYMDQLEVVKNKRIAILTNLQRVDAILLNGLIYRYRTYISSEGLKRGFFIELVVGKCQLFRHQRVDYTGPGVAPTSFHGSGSATFFKRRPTYYYKRHSDVLKRLNKSESVLMDLFQLEYDIFSNYLSDQNLRLRKEKGLIQLFKHMNLILNN